MGAAASPPSGHVFRVERKRGAAWYAKYRLPDGRQVQKNLGPAWTGRGRPAAGYFTKRLAEDWLRSTLEQARRGTLAGQVRTGATFADAAAEFLRYAEYDRGVKPSTLRDYRSNLNAHLLPAFGASAVESITPQEIEEWRASLTGLSSRTSNKLLVVMHGVLRRAQHVWDLPPNPVDRVEKYRQRSSGDIDVFSPEEVIALARAAGSEQDAAIYLTAAFTGLRRGELIALRWRDIDFAGSMVRVRTSYAGGQLTTPKSGKVRSVPLAPEVARSLARLGDREEWTEDDDLVFAGVAGGYLDGSALRRRYTVALGRAGLRPLRFHALRHTFGTRMIAVADIRRLQEWMGHADVQTTMRYLHYAPRADDAALVAKAFALDAPERFRGNASLMPRISFFHGDHAHDVLERGLARPATFPRALERRQGLLRPRRLADRRRAPRPASGSRPALGSAARRRACRAPSATSRRSRSTRSPGIDLMEKLVDITAVEVIDDYRLRLTFEDGVAGDVSFVDRDWRGVFTPFKDPAVFAQVFVDHELGTIAWPGDLDMAPEPLYETARRHPVTDSAGRR